MFGRPVHGRDVGIGVWSALPAPLGNCIITCLRVTGILPCFVVRYIDTGLAGIFKSYLGILTLLSMGILVHSWVDFSILFLLYRNHLLVKNFNGPSIDKSLYRFFQL